MQQIPFLSILVWLPIICAAILLFTSNKNNARVGHWIAIGVNIVSLAIAIWLWVLFDTSHYQMQFTESHEWISAYGIYYALGVDGISLPMVVLTIITTLIVILASWRTVTTNATQYLATFLIVEGMMVGVFCALDSILFYVFWEGMLIPIYLNIGIWGGERRVYASMKFFIYTFAGSALMLVALLYLGIQAHSFIITDFYPLPLSHYAQIMIFFAFLLAFAVKIPLWPVHTWLPDAHTEAPAGGSVVLAALMLKLGVYGFLRFNLPVTPDASKELTMVMIVLALIAIVYIGMIAIVQKDMKRLIAYSSIAHMGFAVLGTFMVYIIAKNTGDLKNAYLSLEGAMMQMISHAFSTGALFIGVGILYYRVHSRLITSFSGLAYKLPLFAAFMMIFALSNVGMPGTSGFIGEFMIILASFTANFWIAFLAGTTLVVAAAYTLWMYKRVFFGKVIHAEIENIQPLYWQETLALGILAAIVLVLGVYPAPVLNLFHASTGHLLQLSMLSKIPV
jgi:NADH-quinone oxidoreductase subunit M